jgi:HK97 family phage prohead protease
MSAPPAILHRSLTVRLAAGETAPANEIPVIASSEAMDDYGEVIEQASWRLDRFLRAPVALWQHESWEDPIGYFKDVRVEQGALRATLVPYTGAADPEGRGAAVLARYAQGGPISVSVGFCPGTVDTEERPEGRVRVLRECELYEISVVSIGSNPEAVALRAARRLRERRTKGTPMTLKEYLAARGMSPEECASASGIPAEELAALMGGTAPTEDQVAKLAQAFGLSPEEVQMMFTPSEEEKQPAADPPPPPAAEGDDEEKKASAFGRAVLAALGMKSTDAALARIATLVDGEKSAKDLAARVAKIEAERAVERRSSLIAAARADGRLTPAREQKLAGYLAKLASPEALGEYLGTLEPALDLQERQQRKPPQVTTSTKGQSPYTDEQREAALAANEQRRAARARG